MMPRICFQRPLNPHRYVAHQATDRGGDAVEQIAAPAEERRGCYRDRATQTVILAVPDKYRPRSEMLVEAVRANRPDLVAQICLKDGASANGPRWRTDSDHVPLLVAAKANSQACLAKLLDVGAKINVRCLESRNAAYWAAENGHPDCLEILCQREVDLNHVDIARDTPLHVAARAGNRECAEILIRHGARLNRRNRLGRTPTHEAAAYGDSTLVQILHAHGADVNAQDFIGETPLHKAAAVGHVDTVRLLLDLGSNARAVDFYGETSVDLAASGGHVQVHAIMVAHGASVDV
ncbi:Ankyrin repeat [Lecanosticta acicola]|uniref:Ankyrin repeat n=1 Tax=Lecanosticta acicola TaxID=111012 RepID=A0AAI8Z5D0_9PEZI|nr:Ankyrin repeat [Lecanosticta acicola]